MSGSTSTLIVLDINTDESEEIMKKYNVEVVPTYVALGKNFNVIESNKKNNIEIIGYHPEKIKGLFKKLKN